MIGAGMPEIIRIHRDGNGLATGFWPREQQIPGPASAPMNLSIAMVSGMTDRQACARQETRLEYLAHNG